MEDKRLELLQGMAIFGGIREDTLELLLQLARIVNVNKGDFYFKEGDPGTSVFVLESGRVVATKLWNGEQHILHYFGAGDCFGEMALMDFSSRSATVTAVEESGAIEISSACLYRIRKKDLEQFTLIQMNMGREVSRRLREADEQLFRIHAEGAASTGGVFRLI
jgi:CRP-like cAMP-binding protein